MDATGLREGIFALNTRRFGRVAEHTIQALARLGKARDQFHDLYDDRSEHRIEVKFSRVLRTNEAPVEPGSILAAVDGDRLHERMVAHGEAEQARWDCNIQQVKRAEFDALYYGLFFADVIACFRVPSAEVGTISGYSDHQHKGNPGEGQFHIKPTNLGDHEQRFGYATLSYEKLLDLLSRLDAVPRLESN